MKKITQQYTNKKSQGQEYPRLQKFTKIQFYEKPL
jgi:hypothetical protein